jgi:glycine dehydrogenase subunit 1
MRYVPHTDEDRAEMLAAIGATDLDDLFQDVPDELRLKQPLGIPESLDEHALMKYMGGLAAESKPSSHLTCFLGAGCYDHFIPATVGTVISRGEFLTSYTPYQPELSQGYLQTIYEFQSMICELTGMDVTNASLYDGATALAEGALLAVGETGRNRILASEAIHPHYRQVVKTMAWSADCEYEEIPAEGGATHIAGIGDDVACVLLQYPNFFGVIEDARGAVSAAHDAGALAVCCSDPIALGVLNPPGAFGADVVVGEGQPLGSAMGFGGPLLGLFSVKREHVRRLPGRVVGVTQDSEGRRGFVMTLRTREQDIRREKATSNICTNQALVALAATVYMTALGKRGFRQVAEDCVRNAHYAAERLTAVPGVCLKFPNKPFAFEFVLELPRPAAEVRDALVEKGILAGLPLGDYYPGTENCLLTCVTEVRTKDEIDGFAEALKEVLS